MIDKERLQAHAPFRGAGVPLCQSRPRNRLTDGCAKGTAATRGVRRWIQTCKVLAQTIIALKSQLADYCGLPKSGSDYRATGAADPGEDLRPSSSPGLQRPRQSLRDTTYSGIRRAWTRMSRNRQ